MGRKWEEMVDLFESNSVVAEEEGRLKMVGTRDRNLEIVSRDHRVVPVEDLKGRRNVSLMNLLASEVVDPFSYAPRHGKSPVLRSVTPVQFSCR